MGKINWSTIRLFFLWLIIVPPGIIYIYINYFPEEINWLKLLAFVLFGFLTAFFPITRNGKPVFLVMWVTVPAFLMYGLLIEIIIMQLSILAFLFSIEGGVDKVNRFFLNSLLYFLLSIAGATAFNFTGGEIGSIEFWSLIIAVFAYQLVHTILNDIAIKTYSLLFNRRSNYFTKDVLLNYATVFVILPFSLTLYLLIQYVGFSAFILIGAPFFFVVITLKLYNNSEKINDNLQQAGAIGHGLSNNPTENKVIDQFVRKVSELFATDFTYLFDHKDGWLELIRSYEQGEFIDIIFNRLSPGQGIAGAVLLENKPVIYSKREDWLGVSKDYTPEEMQSILCLPISRNQKIEAVLFLSSKKKDAFEQYQLQILDILCSYFTVSVEKARYVEETVMKSERCALTNLYNYLYLEERLDAEMKKVNDGIMENLSILMLDIDHFKQVNDSYGHQSGNDILKMLAGILQNLVPNNGIVGRYGGEEFVFILPDTSKSKAVLFAEKVRLEIESYGFQVFPDLGENRLPVEVNITVSIGVSAAPEDTDEAKILLRNADRSLYLWAKQAGRNRVAGYIK